MNWLKDTSKENDNYIFIKWFAIVNLVGFILSAFIWFMV
jgi:hypothetical protein